MATRIRHVAIDCRDPFTLGSWWATVLGAGLADDDEPDDPFALVDHGEGPPLLFVGVEEAKQVKNRLHLDLQPTGDRTRDEEVQHLLDLGATVHEDHRTDDGHGWVTMLDIEGNEFCVERSAEERSSGA